MKKHNTFDKDKHQHWTPQTRAVVALAFPNHCRFSKYTHILEKYFMIKSENESIYAMNSIH